MYQIKKFINLFNLKSSYMNKIFKTKKPILNTKYTINFIQNKIKHINDKIM